MYIITSEWKCESIDFDVLNKLWIQRHFFTVHSCWYECVYGYALHLTVLYPPTTIRTVFVMIITMWRIIFFRKFRESLLCSWKLRPRFTTSVAVQKEKSNRIRDGNGKRTRDKRRCWRKHRPQCVACEYVRNRISTWACVCVYVYFCAIFRW